MSKEKQIEEMVSIINSSDPHYECNGTPCRDCEFFFVQKNCYAAKALYNAGYRKQSEGEWKKRTFIFLDVEKVGFKCSQCNTTWDTPTKFCPNCGARMKDGTV